MVTNCSDMQLISNSNKKHLKSRNLFLMWKMEEYPSHNTSMQYFEQVLILNTQYDYEKTRGSRKTPKY